jgi:hypothetical protein
MECGLLPDHSLRGPEYRLWLARRLHDEHLSVGSYHLFRLPEEVEQDLHALVQSSIGEELAKQVPKARKRLWSVEALGLRIAKPSEGPTAVGSIKDSIADDT